MKEFLAQIKKAPGREYEQAFIRISIGLIIFIAVILTSLDDPNISKLISIQVIIYSLSGLLLLFWIYKDPSKNQIRYAISSGIDVIALSCLMFYSGEMSGAFFAIYLWIIFGFGFRFGSLYLFIASAQSIIGFTTVYLTSTYWSDHPSLFYSLLTSLIVLPSYVSTLLQRLNQSIEKANIANKAKSQFLANMTHELRTPLNGIFCSNDLLKTTKLTSNQKDYVDSIEYSVDTLLALINDILDLSKIESGKFESIPEDFDLHALLNSTVMMLKNHAHEKGLELQLHVMPDVPFSLHGDKTHTVQVLINITGNAIKYTNNGHVKINASLVSRENDTCLIRYEIEDTGVGIPEDKQDSLFERFTQVDSSDTRQYEGSGLGATIAKELVEKLGGTIGFNSELHKGSTFWFELPYKVRIIDKNADEALKNVKVLILRDRDNLLTEIHQDLEHWKVNTIEAFTASDALNIVEQHIEDENPLHAIIIAKSTLEINIVEFSSLLKNKNILDNINLIFLNGDINDDVKKEIIASGVDYILPLGVDKSVLYNAIHSAPLLRPKDETIEVFSHHKNAKTSHPIKILIAEDNAANQYLFERILNYAGFEVTIANNGQEALDTLIDQTFDLCVMDMQMPVMSGVQAIKLYRYMEPDSTLPFIILTANATQEATKACEETGAEAYITKPVRAHLLVDKIHNLINIKVKDNTIKVKSGNHNHDAILDYDQINIIDDKGVFENMVKIFSDNLQTNIEKITEAINNNDYSEYKTVLHSIKGIAGNFGAIQLYKVVIDAEKITHTQFLQGITEQATLVTYEIHRACQALQDYANTLVKH